MDNYVKSSQRPFLFPEKARPNTNDHMPLLRAAGAGSTNKGPAKCHKPWCRETGWIIIELLVGRLKVMENQSDEVIRIQKRIEEVEENNNGVFMSTTKLHELWLLLRCAIVALLLTKGAAFLVILFGSSFDGPSFTGMFIGSFLYQCHRIKKSFSKPYICAALLFSVCIAIFSYCHPEKLNAMMATANKKNAMANADLIELKKLLAPHKRAFDDLLYTSYGVPILQDFDSLPEFKLFTEGKIKSLTELYAVRRSFKEHLKKFEAHHLWLKQQYLQETIINDQLFLQALLTICEKLEVWPQLEKRKQGEFIDGFKRGFLSTMQKMKPIMREHNISSVVEFKIAHLKESLKMLDTWQDLLIDNSKESNLIIEKRFDLHLKKITEIVEKESAFIGSVEKNLYGAPPSNAHTASTTGASRMLAEDVSA